MLFYGRYTELVNGPKLNDGGWRRKTRNAEKSRPSASVRWSAVLGGGSVHAEVMYEISVVRELLDTKLIGHNCSNHLADLPTRPSRSRHEQAAWVVGDQIAGEISKGAVPCG